MEPGPEDYARMLSDRRAEMERARTYAHLIHSRTGLLKRFVRVLADRIDPSGRARSGIE